MTTTTEKAKMLQKRIGELPPDLQQQVAEFVETLLDKRTRKPTRCLTLTWRGALRALRDQYTSVELQHKLHEWRAD